MSSTKHSNSEIDRGVMFILRHKVALFLLIVFGAVSGVAISFAFKPLFRADVILIPSEDMVDLSDKGVLGSLGGLASLVGGSAAGSKQNESIETLKSRVLTTQYIEENSLLPILFKSRWNESARKWNVDSLHGAPTLEDGFTLFDKSIRIVSENRKTGLVTLSILWTDPQVAKKWADDLVSAANDRLRRQAIERSGRNIDYLRKASEATNVMEVKTTIYKIMESQINKQMVATGNKDYAFRIVDPATVPEHKVSPVRSVYLLVGAILAPLLWFGLFALRNFLARSEL